MEICNFYICSSVKPGNNNSLATINTHIVVIVVINIYLLLKTSELVEELTDSRPKERNIEDVADNILLAIKARHFFRTGLLVGIQIRGGRHSVTLEDTVNCHSVLGARKVVWEQGAHLEMKHDGNGPSLHTV